MLLAVHLGLSDYLISGLLIDVKAMTHIFVMEELQCGNKLTTLRMRHSTPFQGAQNVLSHCP